VRASGRRRELQGVPQVGLEVGACMARKSCLISNILSTGRTVSSRST
jgi:hypothetical protein